MPNLEGQLGELTGYLKALVPTLEKVEERQSEADKKAAGHEAKLEGIRTEFNELKNKVSNRIGEHYKSINGLGLAIQERKTEIDGLKTDVAALKERNTGIKQRIWDIVKILITVAVTLIAAKLFGK